MDEKSRVLVPLNWLRSAAWCGSYDSCHLYCTADGCKGELDMNECDDTGEFVTVKPHSPNCWIAALLKEA